jgi:beta-glucanase (GH16 family)
MKPSVIAVLLALGATAVAAGPCPKGWSAVWADEFTDVKSLKKWNYELYDGSQYSLPSWGNNELEWYTNRTDNANVALGKLVITARATDAAARRGCCANGPCKTGQCKYTSARLRTYKKFSFAPEFKDGSRTMRIAARMKLPSGNPAGLWPSLWLLPEASPANCSGCGAYGPWPSSGVITVAQFPKQAAKEVTGGIGYGAPAPDGTFSNFVAPLSKADDYHEYVLEWSRSAMTWYVDGKVVHSAASARNGTLPNGWFSTGAGATKDSPFDKKFHLIVNMAVGGAPTAATAAQVKSALKTPKNFLVDYIRVCRK